MLIIDRAVRATFSSANTNALGAKNNRLAYSSLLRLSIQGNNLVAAEMRHETAGSAGAKTTK